MTSQGYKHSDEAKQRISEAVKKRYKTKGHHLSGKSLPDEWKKNQAKCKVGDRNPGWSGGRVTTPQGYVLVLIGKHHPMANRDGYVFEHRYIVAEDIGRALLRHEHVHHINGDRADNRLENLILVDRKTHGQWHASRVNRNEIDLIVQWHEEGMSPDEIHARLHASRFEHLLERQ